MERKDQEHVLSVEGESEADSFYHWRDVLTWTPPIEQPILVAEIRRAESRIVGAPPGDAMFILDIGVISGGQVSVMTGAVKQVHFWCPIPKPPGMKKIETGTGKPELVS